MATGVAHTAGKLRELCCPLDVCWPLHDIADGRRWNLHEGRPYPFPELEELIEGATRPEPDRRATP
jgi:hypothetical protein